MEVWGTAPQDMYCEAATALTCGFLAVNNFLGRAAIVNCQNKGFRALRGEDGPADATAPSDVPTSHDFEAAEAVEHSEEEVRDVVC